MSELTELCLSRSWSIGFAESCTGGLLSSWVSSRPGASRYFRGSVVCYHREVKNQILQVPLSMILAHGEVSVPVAQAMAHGARKVLSADWTISITGIAGPTGGSVDKPVGTVCFGLAGPGFEEAQRQQMGAQLSRQDIQQQSAFFALDFLINAMK